MVFMEWDESLSVQVKEIDGQHKKLIGVINKAHEIAGKREEFGEIFTELIEYVRIHFSTEEKYFEEFDYADKEEHVKEHLKLTEQVLDFKNKYDSGDCDCEGFLDFLKEWVGEHLKVTDQKYVKCFKEHGLK